MHSKRDKANGKRPQTVHKSPVYSKSGGTSPSTPTPRTPWPTEVSETFLLSDSPVPDGLGSLSLSTPKRKSKMFGEAVPPHSKAKQKICAQVNPNLKTSQGTPPNNLSEQIEFPVSEQAVPSTAHSFVLRKAQQMPEEGSKAICRMALMADTSNSSSEHCSMKKSSISTPERSKTTLENSSFLGRNSSEVEYSDTHTPHLECISDSSSCCVTLQNDGVQCPDPSLPTEEATVFSHTLSTKGSSAAIQVVTGSRRETLFQMKGLFSATQSQSPGTSPPTWRGISHFSDPFALPVHSKTTRRHSAAEFIQWSNHSRTRDTSNRRLSSGAQPHLHSHVGFIDTHCHLDMLYGKLGFRGTFESFRKLHRDSFTPEFRGCITNFCNPRMMVKDGLWEGLLAEEMVWGAFGCHPHFANHYSAVHERNILTAMRHPKAVAFGEMGLDYSHKNSCDIGRQKEAFERQLRLAVAMQKPLLIHCREADNDLMEIMKKCVPADYKIHRHCFTNSYQVIEPFLREFPNLYVGFTALITYVKATEVRNALRHIPLNRIVLETDAPFFLPRHMKRDVHKFSHPGMGIHTLHELSLLKEESMDAVLTTVRRNTTQLYGI